MHWPLIVSYPEEEDSYFHMPNRHEIIDFFVEQQVSCVLAGHLHQDVDINWKGIPMITAMTTSRPISYPEEVAFKLVTVFDGGWSARRVSVAEGEA